MNRRLTGRPCNGWAPSTWRMRWRWLSCRPTNPAPPLMVAFCGRNETHVPHWHGEHRDDWCNGAGLAGRCGHGVQMLDHCDKCAAHDIRQEIR